MNEKQPNNVNNQNVPNNQGTGNANLENAQQNTQMRNDGNVQSRNSNLEPRTKSSPKSSNSATIPTANVNSTLKNHQRTPGSNLKQQVAMKALNKFGGPAGKIMSNPAVLKKMSKSSLVNAIPGVGAVNRLHNVLNNGKKFMTSFGSSSSVNDDDNTSNVDTNTNQETNDQIEEKDDGKREVLSGTVDLMVKIKKYKWFLIGGLSVFSIVFTLCIIAGLLTNATVGAGVFANEAKTEDLEKTAEDRSKRKSTDEFQDVENDVNNESSYINDDIKSNVRFVKNKLDVDAEDIADYYGVSMACGGEKTKKCTDGTEYKFYLKMYDIYYLYKNQYHVKLDLPYIMAALNYSNEQMPKVFSSNLNEYNREDIKSGDYTGDLSWEFDYKNYEGYKYLNANDNRFDMQILAKNMVKKEITYNCNSETKEVYDVETSKYDEKLTCDSGTVDKDSINETYKIDLDKYKEFLHEFVEHKYFLPGSAVEETKNNKNNNSSSTTANSLASAMVKYALNEFKINPNSNPSKYLSFTRLPSGTAWCAAFVNYVASHAKYNGKTVYDIVNIHSGSTGAYMNYFLSGKNGTKFYYNDSCSYYKGKNGSGKYTPKPGDYMIYSNSAANCSSSLQPTRCHEHIGIIEKTKNGVVHTIEGNGGRGVLVRNRFKMSNCKMVGFGSWY